MKTIDQIGAQGDVLFVRVPELPSGLKRNSDVQPIVAHSESGHHHRAKAARGWEVEHFVQDSRVSFLRIRARRDEITAKADAARASIDAALSVVIDHEKGGPDAHESVALSGDLEGDAVYRVLRQAELRPSGWEVVED